MRYLKLLAVLALAMMASACAGALPWNSQVAAGMSDVKVDWDKTDDGSGSVVTGFRVLDGKERGAVSFEVAFSDGTILNYASQDEKAFEGQALRADVEKAIVETVGEVAPGVVDAVITAITGGVP